MTAPRSRSVWRRRAGWVDYQLVEGVVHGFFTLGKAIPEAGRAVALAAAALRRALRGE